MEGQDDCSSVLSVRSRGLQMSMAASLVAHVALAITVISMMPARTISLGDPNAMQVAFINLVPLAQPSRPDAAKVQPERPVRPVSKAIARPEKTKQLPVVDHAEVVLKPPAKTRLETRKIETATQAVSLSSPLSLSKSASQAPQAHGAQPAEVAKVGTDDHSKIIVTAARFRVPPKPAKYPKRAHDLNQQGEALIRARIDFEGNTAEVLVWKSSGFVLLDNAALSAVRRWQFMPERRNGMPVVAWVEIPVRFRLNDF
jgi:protein TonB